MTAPRASGANPFVGRWKITEMETWPLEYVDLIVPGHITIARDREGEFQFGAVHAWIDYRITSAAKEPKLEFSWEGKSERDPISGRGWATVQDGELRGQLFIHMGDDSWFIARKGKRAI